MSVFINEKFTFYICIKYYFKILIMKSIILSLFIAFVLGACSSFNLDPSSSSSKSNTLKGDVDISMNTVGNKLSAIGLSIDDSGVYTEPSIEIIKSEDGVNTFKVVVDLSKDPNLASFNRIIPDELKDEQGRISFETKLKITSEGWLDYSNIDEEPVVIVRYDCKVGDKYSVTTKSGSKIVREITHKSTTDDYDYGFLQIKVIKVEQETSFPGFKKYVGYFNHKFGMVGLEIVAEDGTTLSSVISADMY